MIVLEMDKVKVKSKLHSYDPGSMFSSGATRKFRGKAEERRVDFFKIKNITK